ncbi:MAG: sodium:solute symporter [Verrucomicrobiota bacterium]|nr:sodium:solute symporter [Verrucomicrobiota bacterium]
MSWIDYVVLLGTLLVIALYGHWRTRRDYDLGHYLHGDETIRWGTIALSVMAAQASAITFLSTPGQGFESGLGFVQNYFGLPFALLVVCGVFIPIFHRLKVITAYEYLGQRFDQKTRLLGAFLFLVQRGLSAGITIYAPAIIVSAILGWNLQLTIILTGLFILIYTAFGGTKAVSITGKWQMAVILFGMAVVFGMIIHRLPADLSLGGAFSLAGKMGKLNAVDFSLDPSKRYTFWSGLLGGFFLALSYFGTDQSQVQRYLAGGSLVGSRFGLLFNAVVKVPMQFLILLTGVMVFVFFQFEKPPIFFNQPAYQEALRKDETGQLAQLQTRYDAAFARKQTEIRAGNTPAFVRQEKEVQQIRDETKSVLRTINPKIETKDSDYVFITFVLKYLPHGVIGLLMAVIFCAAASSTAAELNALGSTTEVDFYRPLVRPNASQSHYLFVAEILTAAWGLVAIGFALFANLVENLIEAVNILGSIFYGPILGLFIAAFFLPSVRGTAVFLGALGAQAVVLLLFWKANLGYLWLNPIGCVAVCLFALVLQKTVCAMK